MIEGLIGGRIYGEAERRTDKAGRPFVVAKVRATTGDGDTLFVNVIAFQTDLCDDLLALRDGDALSIAGALTPKVWTDKQGNVRPALDLVAQRMTALVLPPDHD